MTEPKQEIDWIEFRINNDLCRIDRHNSNNLQKWTETWRGRPMSKPRWKPVTLSKHSQGYMRCYAGLRSYRHHRLAYYAHNPEWNIDDRSSSNQIDHKDNDKTNNNISNLRVATNAENMQNRYAKGYWYIKKYNKWRVRLSINGKQINLGSYDTEDEAHQVYLKAKREHHPFFHES